MRWKNQPMDGNSKKEETEGNQNVTVSESQNVDINSRTKNKDPFDDQIFVEDPFKRRDSIQRTPPRDRANSLPCLDPKYIEDEDKQEKKRKRTEETHATVSTVQKNIGKATADVLEMIFKQVKNLGKVIKETYKPKREFVEIFSRLNNGAEKLKAIDSMTWLENTSKLQDEYAKLLEENKKLLAYNHTLESTRTNGDAVSEPECEACKILQAKRLRQKRYKRQETLENFLLISEEEWGSNIFDEPGNANIPISEAGEDWDMILPCDRNIESTYKEVSRTLKESGGRQGS